MTSEVVLSWEQRLTVLQEEYDRKAAESETRSQELVKVRRLLVCLAVVRWSPVFNLCICC